MTEKILLDALSQFRKFAGRVVGAGSALVSASGLAVVLAKLLTAERREDMAIVIISVMLLFGIAAFWAAIRERGLILLILFFLSFVPVGFYLALNPSWAGVAGRAQLGYLVAAVWMLRKPKIPGVQEAMGGDQ